MDFAREEGIDKRKHTLSRGLKVCQHIQFIEEVLLFCFSLTMSMNEDNVSISD